MDDRYLQSGQERRGKEMFRVEKRGDGWTAKKTKSNMVKEVEMKIIEKLKAAVYLGKGWKEVHLSEEMGIKAGRGESMPCFQHEDFLGFQHNFCISQNQISLHSVV